jgi:rhodanese-related sulfurtransferase
MYIDIKDIKQDDVTIDVRTEEEYYMMPFFDHNVSVINKAEHTLLKKRIYLAIPIILRGLKKDKERIKNELLTLSCNKTKRLIIGCSRGRLRSPIVCLYAKILGIDAKVLKKGIKRFFKKDVNTIKNLYGFLDI